MLPPVMKFKNLFGVIVTVKCLRAKQVKYTNLKVQSKERKEPNIPPRYRKCRRFANNAAAEKHANTMQVPMTAVTTISGRYIATEDISGPMLQPISRAAA
jgi:hypothetical protein